jgi:hypothetical protein
MKILTILGFKKSDKDKKVQERIARQLKRGQEKLIDDLDAKKDKLLVKKESLEVITVETSDNILEKWNQDYHQVLVDIRLVEAEITIANETLTEMFTENEKKSK